METNYPNLRRPKRKLCYLTNTESLPKWTAPLTVEDVDKMFDDLDPSSHNDDDLSHPCPLLQTFDTETNQCERKASPVPQEVNLKEKLPKCQMDPEGEVLHPATRSPSPKLDIDLDIPFKAHGPMKTSSPIEENMVVGKVEELDNEKDQVVTPLLFACDDDEKEKANTDPLPIQEPQCNGQVEEEIELESPPSTVVFSKPEKSSHKNKVEGSCKESHPVKEKIPKKPQAPVLEDKRKTPRRENVDPPVPAERQEPELAAPKKDSERVHKQPSVVLSRVEKDMTAFLKKLRDAAQPKPACPRKSLSPVKEPTPPPPEPDDDFLILEDDRPLWFSIPSKTATSRKQKQSKTSSTDRDSSTDGATKESPLETAQKQQESEQANDKLGSQTVSQKTKKMKGKEKKNEVIEPENDREELSRPEDLPDGDLRKEEAPNKKKRLKKVPSKEGDKEEEQPKDTASRKTSEDEPTLKKEKKAQKSSDVKRSKSVKDGNENAKASRSKAVKGTRKVTQGSDAGKTRHAEAGKEQSQSNEEHANAEDLGSPPEEEIINSEAPIEKDAADGKDKHNKLPAVSEKSSSDDCQTPGKRKRRQPGEWWLNHQITEETKVSDTQPTPKKSKQYNKKPSASVPSPVKTKKDRVLKKRNQTQPSPSSSQNTTKAKGKKTTQKKNRNTRRDKPNKVSHTIEAEQIEEQEQLEILDQGQDEGSSPLVLTERDYSLNSGEQVFPRVYHHAFNEKQSITPAPVSPRGPGEQLRAAEPQKRRRKPPRNWWAVGDMSEDISSQPQQQEPKPRKERKKQSKQSRSPRLGTPKNGNMAVSSKPPGGTPVPPVKPKTVKRSLATMKDIFSAVTETPAVVSSRETLQNKRHKVSASPAVNVTVTDCASVSRTDTGILSMDADEFRKEQNSAVNHVAPQDSQTEDRLQLFRSGPSSMIELQQYEEDEDLCLPPARVPAALSISDLCAPPLKPLVLQSKDKANLAEWFQSLWPVDKGVEITPDKFDWYFYQGRAIGFLVDLNCGSICNGKILLGSYMKKPLWVDHSATTVFELITSSVSVVIDSKESRFHPGQSFMVPCGHAYSIQNVNAQPAVVYFTRILAESSD